MGLSALVGGLGSGRHELRRLLGLFAEVFLGFLSAPAAAVSLGAIPVALVFSLFVGLWGGRVLGSHLLVPVVLPLLLVVLCVSSLVLVGSLKIRVGSLIKLLRSETGWFIARVVSGVLCAFAVSFAGGSNYKVFKMLFCFVCFACFNVVQPGKGSGSSS